MEEDPSLPLLLRANPTDDDGGSAAATVICLTDLLLEEAPLRPLLLLPPAPFCCCCWDFLSTTDPVLKVDEDDEVRGDTRAAIVKGSLGNRNFMVE